MSLTSEEKRLVERAIRARVRNSDLTISSHVAQIISRNLIRELGLQGDQAHPFQEIADVQSSTNTDVLTAAIAKERSRLSPHFGRDASLIRHLDALWVWAHKE